MMLIFLASMLLTQQVLIKDPTRPSGVTVEKHYLCGSKTIPIVFVSNLRGNSKIKTIGGLNSRSIHKLQRHISSYINDVVLLTCPEKETDNFTGIVIMDKSSVGGVEHVSFRVKGREVSDID